MFNYNYIHDPESKVVYARTLKCASTSYKSYFLSNNWTMIRRKDIPPHAKLFTYIREPEERAKSALLEDVLRDIKRLNIVKIKQFYNLLNNNFINHDHGHNTPLIQTHKNHLDRIIMIPLNHNTEKITNIFFEHCGIDFRIIESEVPKIHITKNETPKLVLSTFFEKIDHNYYTIDPNDELIYAYLINNINFNKTSHKNNWEIIFDETKWFSFLKNLFFENYQINLQ